MTVDILLGAKIKELRKQKDFTLEQLAKKIGARKGYIWDIENNVVKHPSALKLSSIAKALDVTIDYLIDDTQTEVGDDTKKKALYLKLDRLEQRDQDRIMDIINAWGKS